MTERVCPDVCAVVVSYRPDPTALAELTAGLASQVGAVVLVDNASEGAWLAELDASLRRGGGSLIRDRKSVV